MSFNNDEHHPYYAVYNWNLEKLVNGGDNEIAFQMVCRNIIDYDLVHTACMDVVREYDERV